MIRGRGSSRKALGVLTVLTVISAFMLNGAGSALASHIPFSVNQVDMTPDQDAVPAGTCNSFTVHLLGETTDSQTQGETIDTQGETIDAEGETVDVRVSDTDGNPTPVSFCTPQTDTQNNQPTSTSAVKDTPTDYNSDGDPELPGNDGTIQGETCCTDQNGYVTFGITSSQAGSYQVTAFYDLPEDDENQSGDPQDTSSKRFFTPGVTVGQGPCKGYKQGTTNETQSGTTVIVGTSGPDVLLGTPGPDIICGLASDDQIKGFGSNDLAVGNRGADTIKGGAGKDQLQGNRGRDEIDGGTGNDVLVGGLANDTLRGNDGYDTVKGREGDDTAQGGKGQDIVRGAGGADTLKGYKGNDILSGGTGPDDINGGPGFDVCSGGPGSDTIQACEDH